MDGTRRMQVNEDRDGSPSSVTDDYDLLPYPSMPYTTRSPRAWPRLLRSMGSTRRPPDAASVLELGCASGGNIIPLAARFPAGALPRDRPGEPPRRRRAPRASPNWGSPTSRFAKAIWPSSRSAPGAFDYVICHGVFSWAPRAVQDAIFRICREASRPTASPQISYNVLPGWHMRSVIRDICLRHTGSEGSPQQRVAKARAHAGRARRLRERRLNPTGCCCAAKLSA